jgi:hypothetical protein
MSSHTICVITVQPRLASGNKSSGLTIRWQGTELCSSNCRFMTEVAHCHQQISPIELQ